MHLQTLHKSTTLLVVALAVALLPSASALATARADGLCVATGGVITKVFPYGNTNSAPKTWLRFGGSGQACTYTDGDGASITAWVGTLESPKPTMAALAYYAKVPWDGQGGGNPAAHYCIQLGGTQLIGAMASGSGWASHAGAELRDMCMFADMSAIDAWGLLYHANEIIRGKDLSAVIRFPNPYISKP